MALEGIVRKLKERNPESKLATFLSTHQETVTSASTILAASLGSIVVSAGYAEWSHISGQSAQELAGYTTLMEFASYTGIFVPLFYHQHRDKYHDPLTKRKEWKKMAKDSGKMALMAIPSGLLFYPISFYFNKKLLDYGFGPAMSTTWSYLGALAVSSSLYLFLLNKVGVLQAKKTPAEKV